MQLEAAFEPAEPRMVNLVVPVASVILLTVLRAQLTPTSGSSWSEQSVISAGSCTATVTPGRGVLEPSRTTTMNSPVALSGIPFEMPTSRITDGTRVPAVSQYHPAAASRTVNVTSRTALTKVRNETILP